MMGLVEEKSSNSGSDWSVLSISEDDSSEPFSLGSRLIPFSFISSACFWYFSFSSSGMAFHSLEMFLATSANDQPLSSLLISFRRRVDHTK